MRAEPTPARRCAYEVVRRTFEHDAWTDRAFRSAADRLGLEGRERAFGQRLAYGAVQRRGTSDHLIGRLSGRSPSEVDAPLLAALRLGLYEVLFAGSGAQHAAVHEAVELAKRSAAGSDPRRARAAGGFANALLRRAARERDEMLASLSDETPADAAVAHSQPRWIAERWWRELGPTGARSLMAAMNRPAERAVRVNTLRADPQALATKLREAAERVERPAGGDSLLQPPETLVCTGRWGAALRRAVAAGELIAQSRASQAVVALLDPQPGERVLDLCAGPGVKTSQIAALMSDSGEVHAVEHHRGRAAEMEQLLGRAGATCVRVVVADAAGDDLGGGYDRVLVDPPCTDLGTLASRPDARWRKRAEQADRLAELQGAILRRAAAAVRPGGTVVYSTCTVSRVENEHAIEALLAEQRDLDADDLGAAHPALGSSHDSRFLQTRPDRDGTSGFFIARLRRSRGEG